MSEILKVFIYVQLYIHRDLNEITEVFQVSGRLYTCMNEINKVFNRYN